MWMTRVALLFALVSRFVVGLTGMQWCALAMTALLLAAASTATAQTIAEFPIPNAADGIVAGPDGALWFTATLGNKIGRITTAGAVTEFLVSEPSPARLVITTNPAVGPDGALWFGFFTFIPDNPTAEFLDFRGSLPSLGVGRITTVGEISKFLLPSSPPASQPLSGLTSGPDCALWFSEPHAHKIGRITTAGEFSEFALPTPTSSLSGITAGPDGALWFIEGFHNKSSGDKIVPTGDKIGRITVTPSIDTPPPPVSGCELMQAAERHSD